MTAKKSRSKGAIKILENLNAVQQEAVLQANNPILILAGAGSGKTRVLTHKIAYLIDVAKVNPWTILAMTFTNKAAGEMRDRIKQLTLSTNESIWMGTFHSIFARILRRECEHIGYSSNFTIYDADDQRQLIKLIMENLGISPKDFKPRAIQAHISRSKNQMISPAEYAKNAITFFEQQVVPIYQQYQSRLKQQNSMDFDDLLWKPIELFGENPLVLEKYQQRFEFILIDEYQDTNRAQYILIKMLSARHRNICVVGDDDQSIYQWRGADVQNILDFEKDFSDCRIFRLEQNYRSTKNILGAANSVVQNNTGRLEKTLWTDKEAGDKVSLLTSGSPFYESTNIVTEIQEELRRHKRNFRDFAILYRTNAQSRSLEEGLRNNAIAYRIVGGTRFYDRKEIKDVLAYLRIIVNPRDTISLKRIINYPSRGLGAKTLQRIDSFAFEHKLTFFEGLKQVQTIEGISESRKNRLFSFYKFIEKYQELQDKLSVPELARALVDEIGILSAFKIEETVEAMSRYENVIELLTAISDFTKRHEAPTLAAYLEEVSLITDIDTWNDRGNGVTLMTLHAAKGLEFPVVFLAGCEEGLFPSPRSSDTNEGLEEERRLFYVGATRAQEKLFLSWAMKRGYGEDYSATIMSRFIGEIDSEFIERDHSGTGNSAWDNYYADDDREIDYDDDSDFLDDVPIIQRLETGQRVRHAKFGAGVVVNTEGYGEKLKAIIQFEIVGRKILMVKYAKLELL